MVELSSHRHFAMKLLLPEKVHDAGAPPAAVPRGRGRPSSSPTPTSSRSSSVDHDKRQPLLRHGVLPGRQSARHRIMAQADRLPPRTARTSCSSRRPRPWPSCNANGWVHRDVKPDNFLVNSAGELRLIDFALATRIQKPSLFGQAVPPQAARRRARAATCRRSRSAAQPLDGRADMYSFGATCYELVTGRPPFRGARSQDLLNKHIAEKPVSPQRPQPGRHRGVRRPGAAHARQEAGRSAAATFTRS